MELIKRILCPVDFSSTSQKAFEYADRLAQSTGAELVLLHAFDLPESYDAAGQVHPADPQLEHQLNAIESAFPDVKITRILHAGPAPDVICWVAQDRQCDLIVMGTHGRTGLRHLLFGSVTEFVLRHARCPVLTVRDRPDDEPPLKEPRVMPLPAPRFM